MSCEASQFLEKKLQIWKRPPIVFRRIFNVIDRLTSNLLTWFVSDIKNVRMQQHI